VFSKLADPDFKPPKQIIFAMAKLGVFGEWQPVYRWALNPLDAPIFEGDGLIDSFEVFESVVEKCRKVPQEVIKKFFSIVGRDWHNYTHHHMFAIEGITKLLFSGQDLSPTELHDLSAHIKQLMHKTAPSEIYSRSLVFLLKTTLMEET
jgi:hypothetical protein